MPRRSLFKYAALIPPTRSCLRSRTVILWLFLSAVATLGFISTIINSFFTDEAVNWTYRGIPLRDAPYGRLHHHHDHAHLIMNHDIINNSSTDKPLGRKLTRNTASENNINGGKSGALVESLNLVLKDAAHLKSRLASATSVYPAPLDNVKDIGLQEVIGQTRSPQFNPHLGCQEIATLKLARRVGRGTTKDVYASVYRNKQVAVKMVSPKVPDIKACLRRKRFRDREECYVYANYKIMKEIAMYQQLDHPNIAKLIGYCIQSDPLFNKENDHGVISVVEFGAKASLHRITNTNWQHGLESAISLADLLDYLEHSPLGSLAIWDYKHSQFIVTSDNVIKYSDMDDLSGDEPRCETQEDCIIPNSNRIRVGCSHSQCHGFNAKFNLIMTTKEFFKPLLKEAPKEHHTILDDMFERLSELSINAKDVKNILTGIKSRTEVL